MKKDNIHFEISERKILLRIVDVLSIVSLLYAIGFILDVEYFTAIFKSPISTFTLIFYIMFFATLFDMYNLQHASNQMQILKSTIIASVCISGFYLITPIITPILPSNRLQIISFFISILGALGAWRLLYLTYFASIRFQKNVLFIGNDIQVEKLAKELQIANPHYKVTGFINTNTQDKTKIAIEEVTVADASNFIRKHNVSEIVMAQKNKQTVAVDLLNVLLKSLEHGIVVREFSQVYESSTYRLPILYAEKDFYNYFPFSRSNNNKLYLIAVRLFDIAFALVGLTVLGLLLPLILIINAVANKGPLFYKQERVGQYGIPFLVYKLRSMVTDAEKNGAQFAQKNDARVTPFGKFIRKTRLDEVPQFINVLKGEMSVIGPRPERPVFVEQIAEVMPFYKTRHVIKPGLTGWAQVKYSYGVSLEDSLIKLQYDLYYIKNRSLSLDLNIMIKTVSTVLFFRGQ